MEKIENKVLIGERAAYASKNTEFIRCIFKDGESPLKESRNIKVKNCNFEWKYPLWYCKDIDVSDTNWLETGRSGVWYTENLTIQNCNIGAPKQFRKCKNIKITDSDIPFAQETLWNCESVYLKNMHVVGDYFGMNSRDVKLYNITIDGNYCFDGSKNIEARNCIFNSKDSFWNCENVVIYDSVITGEYLAWNTKNITFINCTLESNQGLCYIDNVKLVNCKVINTDLCFELCRDIDADIITSVDSIKNPIGGKICCRGVGELILDKNIINPDNTVIKVIKEDV